MVQICVGSHPNNTQLDSMVHAACNLQLELAAALSAGDEGAEIILIGSVPRYKR